MTLNELVAIANDMTPEEREMEISIYDQTTNEFVDLDAVEVLELEDEDDDAETCKRVVFNP